MLPVAHVAGLITPLTVNLISVQTPGSRDVPPAAMHGPSLYIIAAPNILDRLGQGRSGPGGSLAQLYARADAPLRAGVSAHNWPQIEASRHAPPAAQAMGSQQGGEGRHACAEPSSSFCVHHQVSTVGC